MELQPSYLAVQHRGIVELQWRVCAVIPELSGGTTGLARNCAVATGLSGSTTRECGVSMVNCVIRTLLDCMH